MSLIEQAAKRLAELKRSGAELPEHASTSADATKVQATEPLSTPEALVRAVNARKAELLTTSEVRKGNDETLVTVRRVEQKIDQPAVKVEIDLARLRERGFVTPDMPQSTIAHEFRVLKRPIIRNAQGRSGAVIPNGMLIMVTSSLPGEGKTFTSANLAISLAMEFDHTVMLVDGDVAHPTLLDVLGLPQSPGLLDLLTRDDLDVGEVLLQTNLERLTLLPAGTRHRRATELIASEKMGNLLRDLARRFPDRLIIFDSPPLLATTEARVLATHMGQVVLVVAADSTSRKTVRHALATIERCEVVLMMLNKAVKSDAGTYYGYYADDVPD